MFDTHAHIHDPAFDADREATLERARAAGVERILTVGTSLADSARAAAAAERFGLDFSIGIHPHEATEAPADVAAAFDAVLAGTSLRPRAVGEMGLDYYYDHSPRDVQRNALAAQLDFARERNLPAIFHVRDAFDDFVAVLREQPAPVRGVVHCFTGDAAQARVFTGEFGLKLGIGGVLTFKTAGALREAVAAVGLDHIILETDCPYLAPVPYRGRRNEPAFVAATAGVVAELLGSDAAAVAARTSQTARSLFEG